MTGIDILYPEERRELYFKRLVERMIGDRREVEKLFERVVEKTREKEVEHDAT